MARDLKPSEEFNISQQHTELRLLSSDIAKLHISETKPCDVNQHEPNELSPGESSAFDEDELNPLGSEESAWGLEGSEVLKTSNEKPMESGVKNHDITTQKDDFSSTTQSGGLPCSHDSGSNKEFENKAELTLEGPGEDDNDLEEEGALC